MTLRAPRIDTPRLVLRAYALADFDWFADLWRETAVTRFIGGRPRTRAESHIRFQQDWGQWANFGHGFWIVEDRGAASRIGLVGLYRFERGIAATDAMPEAGWSFTERSHGQGFAAEAVGAMLAWADRHVPADATGCIIDPANQPSLRLAERCGYRPIGMAELEGAAVQCLIRPRPSTD